MNEYKVPFHKSELLEHEKNSLTRYLGDIVCSGIFTNGEYLERLENKIAEISNRKYAVAFSSGTAALFCAIKALKMEGMIPTTPFTWIATTNAIEVAGAHPIYHDVNENGLMDMPEPPPGFTQKDIEEMYGGIVPVSLYGQEMNYDAYRLYSLLPMVLDACHSINQLDHLDEDTVFDIMCFSLHPTKLFFAGEGGFAVTNWEALAEMMRRFRYHGLDENKLRRELSIKFSMPESSAACALVTMENFDMRVSLQRKRIRKYLESFSFYAGLADKVRVISTLDCTMMTIKVEEGSRDELWSHIRKAGYCADVKYPDILYNMKSVTQDSYPMTRLMTRSIITLPCYPTMEDRDIVDIVKTIAEFFKVI